MNVTKHPSRSLPLSATVGGAVTLTAALLTRATVGGPLAVLHKLEPIFPLPPLWLTGILWLASFIIVGGAAGYLLTCSELGPHKEALLWRGSTFLVLGVVFSLVWYTLLFGKFFLLPSWICLLLSAATSLVCFLSWIQVKTAAAVAVLLFSLWQVYLVLVQMAILLAA